MSSAKNQKVTKDWFMYVVECADGTYYTGITTELARRLHEHNHSSRGAKYTRSRRPVDLIFWECHANRSLVSKAEARFKKMSRSQKRDYIDRS